MKISFVTSNKNKFEEVSYWLAQMVPGIELEHVDLDVPEIQSLDVREVVIAKAQAIWKEIQRPFIVDDGGLYLTKFKNFPGTLSKYVYQGTGREGFWLLGKDDPRAYFLCIILFYQGPDDYHLFEGKCLGKIIEPGNVTAPSQFPLLSMFVPDGMTKTLAELHNSPEVQNITHRHKALVAFVDWLNLTSPDQFLV